jgi:hypothetical protein
VFEFKLSDFDKTPAVLKVVGSVKGKDGTILVDGAKPTDLWTRGIKSWDAERGTNSGKL